MAHSEARAWWADVQHLRDDYERTDEARRRADEADLASRRATRERRIVEAEVVSVRSQVRPEPPPAPRRDGFAQRRGQHVPDGAPRLDPPPPGDARRVGRVKGTGAPGRATIEIRGRTVPAPAVPRAIDAGDRRRPQRRPVERVGARPDRVAMWALLMGLLLILVALGTADTPAVVSLLLG
jgi:hypothetical protein